MRVRRAQSRSTPARERASGLLLAGWLEASAGNVDRAEVDLESAREIAEELGDEVLRGRHPAPPRLPEDPAGTAPGRARVRGRQPGDEPFAGTVVGDRGGLILGAYGSLMLGDTAPPPGTPPRRCSS